MEGGVEGALGASGGRELSTGGSPHVASASASTFSSSSSYTAHHGPLGGLGLVHVKKEPPPRPAWDSSPLRASPHSRSFRGSLRDVPTAQMIVLARAGMASSSASSAADSTHHQAARQPDAITSSKRGTSSSIAGRSTPRAAPAERRHHAAAVHSHAHAHMSTSQLQARARERLVRQRPSYHAPHWDRWAAMLSA